MDFSAPLVINLALTGMIPHRKDNPFTPITPDEIAEDVERCFQAGARIFHVHARGDDEEPTYRREVFAESLTKIRRAVPEAVLCVTTSGRQYKTWTVTLSRRLPRSPWVR
jgi:uncharacterized protein (DUF849 family)